MSHARTTALLCACALVANFVVVAHAAPAPPARSDNKDSKMLQEKSIVVRRIPNAYFYPFSLWPLPKFPVRDRDESHESFHYRRSLESVKIKQKKR